MIQVITGKKGSGKTKILLGMIDDAVKASTGDITGTIRTAKTFSAHASTGSVRVPDTTGQGRCEANTSTGDIKLSISGN